MVTIKTEKAETCRLSVSPFKTKFNNNLTNIAKYVLKSGNVLWTTPQGVDKRLSHFITKYLNRFFVVNC